MARPKKIEPIKEAEKCATVEIQDGTEVSKTAPSIEQEVKPDKEAEEISARDADLMRLYPQYEKIWITSHGFVHPEGAPNYLLKDAKLYINKYYKK